MVDGYLAAFDLGVIASVRFSGTSFSFAKIISFLIWEKINSEISDYDPNKTKQYPEPKRWSIRFFKQ